MGLLVARVKNRGGVWILREAATDRPARSHEVQEMAAEMLAALDPATREAVIRAAAAEAGLRVLTAEQAAVLEAALDGDGDDGPLGGYSLNDYGAARAALSGEEVPHGD